jgi:hypothetical protein
LRTDSPERLREQLIEVAGFAGDGFTLLSGIEVDILDDGDLDQEDALLADLDVVVASAHSKLRMDPAPMTRRLVAAASHPRVDVLGHVTGRLIAGIAGRGRRRSSTRGRSSTPALSTASRSRSMRDPSARTHPTTSSRSRWTSDASSRSTPMRTRPVSSVCSMRPRARSGWECRPSGSSRRGRSTGCARGRTVIADVSVLAVASVPRWSRRQARDEIAVTARSSEAPSPQRRRPR